MARIWLNQEGAPKLFLTAFIKILALELNNVNSIATILKSRFLAPKTLPCCDTLCTRQMPPKVVLGSFR